MKLLICTTFLLCFGAASIAQRSLIDSLTRQMEKESPVQRLKTRVHLSNAYTAVNMDTAFLYAQENIRIAFDFHADSSTIQSLSLLGLLHTYNNQFDSARYYHKKAIHWSQKRGLAELEARSRNNMAILNWTEENLHGALEQMLESLQIAQEHQLEKLTILCTENIATIYTSLDLPEKALKHYHSAQKLSANTENPLGTIESNLSLALCHDDLGHLDSALYYIHLADSLNRVDKNTLLEAKINGAYGAIYFSLGAYQKAKNYTLKSLRLNEELQRLGQVDNQVNLSMMNFAVGDYANGVERAAIGESFIQEGYIPGNARDVYIYKALNYAALNERDSAIQGFYQFLQINDSLYSGQMTNALSALEVKYKVAEKERLLLEERNKVIAAEMASTKTKLQLANRNNWVVLLILILVVLGVLGLTLFIRQKRKIQQEQKRLREEAQRKKVELMIEMQEKERTRISNDLHDGVCQQLSGLKLAFDTLIPEGEFDHVMVKNKINHLSETLIQSVDQVRQISHNMMPKSLQEFGLVPALESLIEHTFSHTKMQGSFDHHKANQRFNDAIEISLYRIAQELLNNVIKHANASTVAIQLVKSKTYLTLLVEDNGNGLPSEIRKGHGMSNIEVRLASIEGEVNYEAAPEGGTRVMVRVEI